jgi:hypothetical protein
MPAAWRLGRSSKEQKNPLSLSAQRVRGCSHDTLTCSLWSLCSPLDCWLHETESRVTTMSLVPGQLLVQETL